MDFDLYAQEVAAATSQSQVQGALIDLKVTITSAAMLGKKEAVYNALHKLPEGLTESLKEHGIELSESEVQDDNSITYHFDISKVGC